MKKMIFTVVKVIIIIAIVAWMGLFITDYFRAQNGEKPLFCLNEKTVVSDGSKVEAGATCYICTSLGYKYYTYSKSGEAKTGFGPAFIKNDAEKELGL